MKEAAYLVNNRSGRAHSFEPTGISALCIQVTGDIARVLIHRVAGLGKGHVSAASPPSLPPRTQITSTQKNPKDHLPTPNQAGT